jgi:two-component system chemotaxis sensor kinase CheA
VNPVATPSPLLGGLDDLVVEFVIESRDLLDGLDRDLLALEMLPDSPEALSAIFRTVHSLKGTAGLLDLVALERTCHLAESVLARVRDGELQPTAELVDSLLRAVDLVRALLAALEATGSDERVDTSVVERELSAWLARRTEGPIAPRLGDVLIAAGKATPEQVALALATQVAGDKRYLGQILVEEAGVLQEDVDSVLALQGRGGLADSTTRVDLAALDRLADIADRLAAAVGDVETRAATDPTLERLGRQLALLAAMLQDGLQATRRQPVEVLWARMPRLVRDTAGRTGKTVRLETSGGETSIDRLVIDALKDPLAHLVRNAISHGIEPSRSRLAAGKPAEGVVWLCAMDAGDAVLVEVCDDGAGLDLAGIARQAVASGLVSAAGIDQLGNDDIADLVFSKGLSTAEAVTELSGRGVGMDVVRTNVAAVGGQVTVHTRPGIGTTMRIRLPRRTPKELTRT